MFALDKLINEAYGDEPLSFEKLAEMVEDMIILQESLGILSEDTDKSNIVNKVLGDAQARLPGEWFKLLPKFEISERWGIKEEGVATNEARKQFELYMNNIGGTTVEDKLNKIADYEDKQ